MGPHHASRIILYRPCFENGGGALCVYRVDGVRGRFSVTSRPLYLNSAVADCNILHSKKPMLLHQKANPENKEID